MAETRPPIEPRPEDVAPGDAKSLALDVRELEIARIRSARDPLFAEAFARLWAEFGAAHEMESQTVLEQRLDWQPAALVSGCWMRYEIFLVRRNGAFVAVRDHTAIVSSSSGSPHAVVHLSHVLVDPAWRRTGLGGWLRAWPIQTARACLQAAGFPADSPITLVAEMEHPVPSVSATMIRLQAYEKAGFKKVDPAVVKYLQPDFRPPAEIDASGGPRPLPFGLVLRRVGREAETVIRGAELRDLVQCLYRMYGAGFRERDMAGVWASLRDYPADETGIALVAPTGMIKAFYHPGFAAPVGDHIMPMRKFALVAEGLKTIPGVVVAEPAPVTEEDLTRVHTPEYVAAVRSGSPRALAESQKFPWSPELFPSVRLTNGACVAAAQQARKDGVAAAVASGFHHAHADHGEGFCTFNGLVVAAEALRHAGEVRTVAILDLDLHYGNGTAALAATRPWLTACSIYGSDYWENSAYRDVTVQRHRNGRNHVSVALPAGCDGARLRDVLDRHLPDLLHGGKPDLLLYQAGADPLQEDPYSPLALTHTDLLERDRLVFEFARNHALPVAWVLAGGYTRDITKVVEVHLNTFRAATQVFGG